MGGRQTSEPDYKKKFRACAGRASARATYAGVRGPLPFGERICAFFFRRVCQRTMPVRRIIRSYRTRRASSKPSLVGRGRPPPSNGEARPPRRGDPLVVAEADVAVCADSTFSVFQDWGVNDAPPVNDPAAYCACTGSRCSLELRAHVVENHLFSASPPPYEPLDNSVFRV